MARENPLDQYLFEHPELLFSSSVESTVLHPDNPYVLGPHVAAAAQEAYLSPADEEFYGSAFAGICKTLTGQNVLRRRGNRLFWTASTGSATTSSRTRCTSSSSATPTR
ncbi:hypothetical protein [Salmonella enterica]|uniref:hypothetical protein n=1 Tax=Salmonella enterica TaxID=28901 RepID=UPI0035BE5E79